MKRLRRWLCIALAVLCVAGGCAAALADGGAAETVPAAIADALSGGRWEGYRIATSSVTGEAAWDYDPDSGVGAAVVTNDRMNILCLLGPDSRGGLRVTDFSDKAVLQGDSLPCVAAVGLRVTVRYPVDTGEFDDLRYTFRRRDGVWILNNLARFDGEDTIAIEVYDAKLTYENLDTARPLGVARGVYGRRFEQFNVNTFPWTVKAAQAVLTNPPAIPASVSFYGLPQPGEITFPSNRKYSVYTGPGTDYLRGAEGRAAMSTNDWVQVFGRVGDWLLVQYDISSKQMRFGYIEAAALPRGVSVPELALQAFPARLTEDCPVTDDPLCGGGILGIPDSRDVTFLGWLGNDWAYIEATIGGVRVRGFVPAERVEDFAENGYHG